MTLTTFPTLNKPFTLSPSGRQLLPERKASSSAPRFSGMGDLLSAGIGAIDKSRPLELVVSDGVGMLAPRTLMAAGFRGADDARETLIREGAGLVCVALLAGFSNKAMVWAFGNRVGAYNPHGTPAKAWIGAKNLRVFSELYDRNLQADGTSPETARQRFVADVLGNLESSDRKLSVQGRVKQLIELQANPKTASEAPKILHQIVSNLLGNDAAIQQSQFAQLLEKNNADALSEKLLKAGFGKLNASAREALTAHFQSDSVDGKALKASVNKDLTAKEFLQKRLQLALEHLKTQSKTFTTPVNEEALKGGLTSNVNVLDPTDATGHKALISDLSRENLFNELKAFLTHYVDRASFAATQVESASPEALKKAIRETLFAKSPDGLRRLFPQASEGLVTSALKAKTAFTLVPISVAIAANGLTTFFNNYVTRKISGGVDYFPGEETFLKPYQQTASISPFHPPLKLAQPNGPVFSAQSPSFAVNPFQTPLRGSQS